MIALRLGLATCLPLFATSDVPSDMEGLFSDIEALKEQLNVQRRQLDIQEEQINAEHSLVAALTTEVNELKAQPALGRRLSEDFGTALRSCWLILCGALVMFMHFGFAALEAGCCRAKNASNVLMKNLVNVCCGTISWWIFGWALAYGVNEDGEVDTDFMGSKQFAAGGFNDVDDVGNVTSNGIALDWFFQWAFCTTAATIVSGGVAERMQSPTYAAYAFVMSAFIYPVVVAWTWGYGWISELLDVGFIDFAGSGIVHLTGGVSAFAGTVVLGPRKGRFENPELFEAHSLPLVVLGTLSLWFGWYGFNCGSTLNMASAGDGLKAAQVAMNTTLSAATGGIIVFVLKYKLTHYYDVGGLCNGILAGLVSITAGCSNMEAGSAVATGVIGAFVYTGASLLLQKLQIDDPVDASAVHGACGIWGVLAAAIFDWGNGFDTFHGWSGFGCMTDDAGSCREGIWGKVFVVQIVMVLVVCLWAGTLSTISFFIFKMTGLLRISEQVEKQGLDAAKHSPSTAYSIEDLCSCTSLEQVERKELDESAPRPCEGGALGGNADEVEIQIDAAFAMAPAGSQAQRPGPTSPAAAARHAQLPELTCSLAKITPTEPPSGVVSECPLLTSAVLLRFPIFCGALCHRNSLPGRDVE